VFPLFWGDGHASKTEDFRGDGQARWLFFLCI
jgi:hypothetical protein